jgi:hypothetical protein
MYDSDPQIAIYTLPLLVLYPMQLLAGSFFTPYLKEYVKAECERLGIKEEDSDVSDDSSNDDDCGKGKSLKQDTHQPRILAFFMRFALSTQKDDRDEEFGLEKEKEEKTENRGSRLLRILLKTECHSSIPDPCETENTTSHCTEGTFKTAPPADGINLLHIVSSTAIDETSLQSQDGKLIPQEHKDKVPAQVGDKCSTWRDTEMCDETKSTEAKTRDSPLLGNGHAEQESFTEADEQAREKRTLAQTCQSLNNLTLIAKREDPCIESNDERGYLPRNLAGNTDEWQGELCSSVSMTHASLLITGSFSEDSDDGEDWRDKHECHESDIMYEFITESGKLCLPVETLCAGNCGLVFGKAANNGKVNVPTLEKPVLLCMHCSKLVVCFKCWKKSMLPNTKSGPSLSR